MNREYIGDANSFSFSDYKQMLLNNMLCSSANNGQQVKG